MDKMFPTSLSGGPEWDEETHKQLGWKYKLSSAPKSKKIKVRLIFCMFSYLITLMCSVSYIRQVDEGPDAIGAGK